MDSKITKSILVIDSEFLSVVETDLNVFCFPFRQFGHNDETSFRYHPSCKKI